MKAIDFITSGQAFPMPGATRFVRLRAKRSASPYNPDSTTDDWTEPDTLEFEGALASSSGMRTPDGLSLGMESVAYITVNEPDIDIRSGDRIRAEPDDGRTWVVTHVPSSDRNAFTGFRPTREIQLAEWKGDA